jgi:hypothetical protein
MWMCHRPDLLEADREAMGEQSVGGLGGKPASPAVGIKVPADLNLALTIGQWLEQDCPGRSASRSLDDRPGSKSRIASEPRPVFLNERNRFAAVGHRPAANPLSDLHAAVHVIEPVGLVRTPRPDDHPLGLSDDALLARVRHRPIIDEASAQNTPKPRREAQVFAREGSAKVVRGPAPECCFSIKAAAMAVLAAEAARSS